ncbi:MAG: hypothetical protein QOI00_783 [Chloroflexota bacterium]|nr:hypothetical protein [Chloroflexota bacterium]
MQTKTLTMTLSRRLRFFDDEIRRFQDRGEVRAEVRTGDRGPLEHGQVATAGWVGVDRLTSRTTTELSAMLNATAAISATYASVQQNGKIAVPRH